MLRLWAFCARLAPGIVKSKSASSSAPCLELQFHPSNIRSGVRYFFFTRRALRLWGAALALYAAIAVLGLLLSPRVVADVAGSRLYGSLADERVNEGERLETLVERLSRLDRRAESLRLQMSKIHLAYGLGAPSAAGQGGYPVEPAPAPESIYADTIRYGNGLQAQVTEELQVLHAFLSEAQAFESAHQEQVSTTPSSCPLRGDDFVLTSPFGSRRSPFTKSLDFHAGLDLAAPVGTPVHAPADGLVVFAGRYPLGQSVAWWRYGNLVAVRHGASFVTLYGHLDQVLVRVGQRVRQGESIAKVGNTGWSTSSHLHYEVRRWDESRGFVPADPRIYILDHRWRDEESVLVRARRAPDAQSYEPLPPALGRSGP
jgi:murein DD-endopeptidase MepM/ murein hydrolase activator NlpD